MLNLSTFLSLYTCISHHVNELDQIRRSQLKIVLVLITVLMFKLLLKCFDAVCRLKRKSDGNLGLNSDFLHACSDLHFHAVLFLSGLLVHSMYVPELMLCRRVITVPKSKLCNISN